MLEENKGWRLTIPARSSGRRSRVDQIMRRGFCLGALLLALAFPRNTALARWITVLLAAYALFGLFVLTSPPQWLDLLSLIRTVFFVVSFLLVSRMMWVYREPQHEGKNLL